MGKPAARLGDLHVCPMFNGPVPHAGGPVIGPGVPSVLIGNMPAAVMGNKCVCVGPPDTISNGSSGVFIGGKPAARMGDRCIHGGAITTGCVTVLIGEKAGGSGGGGGLGAIPTAALKAVLDSSGPVPVKSMAQVAALKEAAREGKPFCEQCAGVPANTTAGPPPALVHKIAQVISLREAAEEGKPFCEQCTGQT